MSDQPTVVTDPASQQTPATQGSTAPGIDEAAILAHPLYQELERQKNAAEHKASSAEGRLLKATKSINGEEDVPAAPVAPAADDSGLDWKLDNNNRVRLVKDEYTQELALLKAAGAKETDAIRTIALERAELKKGIIPDTSDIVRQAAMSSAPGSISRSTTAPVQLTEHDRRFGITADRKKELEERYPELKEEI